MPSLLKIWTQLLAAGTGSVNTTNHLHPLVTLRINTHGLLLTFVMELFQQMRGPGHLQLQGRFLRSLILVPLLLIQCLPPLHLHHGSQI